MKCELNYGRNIKNYSLGRLRAQRLGQLSSARVVIPGPWDGALREATCSVWSLLPPLLLPILKLPLSPLMSG